MERPTDSSSSAEDTLDALADPVVVCGANDVIEYVNDSAAQLFGEEQAALVGRDAASILPARLRTVDDQPFFAWLASHHAEHGRPVRAPILRADGIEMMRVVYPALMPNRAMVLVLRGVAETSELETDPLRLDSELPAAETSYRAVFDAVPVGVLHFDASARITACNDVFVGQMGSSRELLVGIDMRTVPNAGVRDAVAEALAGREGRFEGEYVSATGGRRLEARAIFSPILKNGRVVGGVGIVDDLTERTKIEARLAQGERMASLGRLAAGVAHEINNPLAYVRTSLDLARREIARFRRDASPAHLDRLLELIAQADDGVERVRVIAGDLKTFSRGDEGSWSPVDLHRVVDAAVNLAWNEVRHRAELVRELAPAPRVMGSESRFVQVLVNLLVNAAQAIPEGDAQHNRITIRVGRAGEDRVFIEVEDTGSGIEPDRLPHVFEPFWTSKPKGVGTGLGLSICHGIVTSAGGEIRVAKSAPGSGSTFRIDLPATVEGPATEDDARGARESGAPPRRRRERILVVDDEPRLALTLKVALEDHYDVFVCESGRGALAALAGEQDYDLVLCDLMMPEVSGMEVYERVREHHPDLAQRFVFMTGGAFTPRAREFLREHRVRRIEKPFGLDRIEALLRGEGEA